MTDMKTFFCLNTAKSLTPPHYPHRRACSVFVLAAVVVCICSRNLAFGARKGPDSPLDFSTPSPRSKSLGRLIVCSEVTSTTTSVEKAYHVRRVRPPPCPPECAGPPPIHSPPGLL